MSYKQPCPTDLPVFDKAFYVFQTIHQINLLNCCSNLMSLCQDDCTVIGYQLFVVMVSVLGLATEEFVTNKALGISE
jgi:hypothetical protein